ncbi:MAG: hypothetical protein LBP68_04770, partial [Acidobacteriota bacterium]|nr:hypothetical protein [Acidobacteriota bacterium]
MEEQGIRYIVTGVLIGLLVAFLCWLAVTMRGWLKEKWGELFPSGPARRTITTKSGLFGIFYFGGQVSDFIRPDGVWDKLWAFCRQEEKGFSWCLICGSAGMGKSRTGLEICQRLPLD